MTEHATLTINEDSDEPLIRLECEGIVEVEPPDSNWYIVEPTAQIIDTFARFFQRLIWKRAGQSGELIRDPETGLTINLEGWATDLANNYAAKICAKMDCRDDFEMTARAWLDAAVAEAYVKEPAASEDGG